MEIERRGVTRLDLLISHFHMDHLQGFPFFTPSYNPQTHIDIHLAPRGQGRALAEPFHKLMEEPSFPVPFHHLGANIQFHELNGECHLGEVNLKTQPMNHPGGSTAFRLEYRGRVLVYLTDHEPYAGPKDESVRDFMHGADLLIREAQYTAAEYEQKRGWGHSTFDAAVGDAVAAEVKRLALFHHDPEHSDLFLERVLSELQSRYRMSGVEILMAREGHCLELAPE